MPTNFDYLSTELQNELRQIVNSVIVPGKGIFAADECPVTMAKRFENVGVECSKETRRQYRQLLFTSDPKWADSISCVVLFHEMLHQKTDDGTPFVELLLKRGIVPAIKVDKGIAPLPGSDFEHTTQGLNDLSNRCEHYKNLLCNIASWRCTFIIGENTPSYHAIRDNANILARYASICQSKGMVPIIEPKVVADGDYSLERAQQVTEIILSNVIKALNDHHVYLEGILLKPKIVTPGTSCINKSTMEEVAMATVAALRRTVPAAVPAITLSSSGQSEELASLYLNTIANLPLFKPWTVTFAFTRALQSSALRAWSGEQENIEMAQKEFINRAKAHSLAIQGKYYQGTVPMYKYRSFQYDEI